MIGFELSEEQRDLQATVHEFARDVIRPAAAEYDEKEETPWPIMQQAHALGLDTYAYTKDPADSQEWPTLSEMINNKNSPDLTHKRVIKGKERLISAANKIYKANNYYVEVARKNKINNFRNVEPGTPLYFPPIAKKDK